MTERILLRAFAKVNYALEVRGLRDDGYHEISSVLQSVSLADELEIERSGGGFELLFEPERVEVGPVEENTVYKAWALLWARAGHELPARIKLHKKIPAGAGLGGGSADAAAVLVGMNEVFGLGLGPEELRGVGARIGADVPFCISGGTALGEGVGDVLTPLPAPPDHHLVLAKPGRSADTGGIYRAYDGRRTPQAGKASVDTVVAALQSGALPGFAGAVGNDLEPVTAELVPEVTAYKREMLRAGALGAAMTGTGTAVYGIFNAEEAATGCPLRAPFVGICEPVGSGVVML